MRMGLSKAGRHLKNVPRLGVPKRLSKPLDFYVSLIVNSHWMEVRFTLRRYAVVKTMAKDLGCTVKDLMKDPGRQQAINLNRYITEEVGKPTLTDILTELAKPGRDPREQFEAVKFNEAVQSIEQVTPGMVLAGVVTNVTAFGAFVDIGVHQDGLVHISQLANRYVSDPSTVVQVSQQVKVSVLEVDIPRKRISLSMKDVLGDTH